MIKTSYPYFSGGRILEKPRPMAHGRGRRVAAAFFAVMSGKAWYCICILSGGVFFLDFFRRASERKGTASFGLEWLFLIGGFVLGFLALWAAKKLDEKDK